jgi:hypothetical protein
MELVTFFRNFETKILADVEREKDNHQLISLIQVEVKIYVKCFSNPITIEQQIIRTIIERLDFYLYCKFPENAGKVMEGFEYCTNGRP